MDRPATPSAQAADAIALSIVIPAYNEAGTIAATVRLVGRYLEAHPFASEVIVVDDGSTDGTAEILARCGAERASLRVLRNSPNQGKGASVKRGMLAARGQYVFFMDADLSVPVQTLDGALDTLARGDAAILIGSRRVTGAQIERRQPRLRESLGFGFTWLTRLLLCPDIVDFTCGFKGFRRDEARALFRLQQSHDWAFDAEILYLARLIGARVHQYPVRWSHQEESRVRFPRDIYRTLASLIRIRISARRAVRRPVLAAGLVAAAQRGCED